MEKYQPYIIDTTLRDGEQTPGVQFTVSEKVKIATLLDALGIDELEAGTPVIGKDEQEAIRIIASSGFNFKTSSWSRALVEDIKLAACLRTDCINISLPVSDIQIETMGKSREWVLKQLKETVGMAASLFSHVTLGAQDASRADIDFLKEYIHLGNEMGAGRIRLADTVGILDPVETFSLVKDLKLAFPFVKMEFHGHNDLGMATANAISAIRAGIEGVSATINGLGERAGNSALEEILAYLHARMGIRRFQTTHLYKLCSYTAELCQVMIHDQKAVIGKNAFRHESGIHTSALLKNPETYQFLKPENFGIDGTYITLGKHSGKASYSAFEKSKSKNGKEFRMDINCSS